MKDVRERTLSTMMGRDTTVMAMAEFLFLHNWGGPIPNASWIVQNSLLGKGRGSPKPFTTSSASGRRGLAVGT